jgi:AcrR family transcriptional regulator
VKQKDETMRDILLTNARMITDTRGIDELSIRFIAKKSGVAVGTVYNYFSNKEELLLALTEKYWKEILLEMESVIILDSFYKQLKEMYDFLKKSMEHSGRILMQSLKNTHIDGKRQMESMEQSLEKIIRQQLEQDKKIRLDIWNISFTKEQYAHFIMMNFIAHLRTKAPDISFFIEIVKRTLY